MNKIEIARYLAETKTTSDMEIDDDAQVTPIMEKGVVKAIWVQAWIRVTGEEIDHAMAHTENLPPVLR